MAATEQDLHLQDLATAAGMPDDLENLTAAIAADESDFRTWQSGVACAISRVEVTWAAHTRADEDPEGFLDAARRDAPHVGHRIDIQRREHVELADDLADLHRRLLVCSPTDAVDEERDQLNATVDRITRHLHDSDCLAWEIANEDLGSGD